VSVRADCDRVRGDGEAAVLEDVCGAEDHETVLAICDVHKHAFISTVADGTLTPVWKPAKRHRRRKKPVAHVGSHTRACVVLNSHSIGWSASGATPPKGESSKKQPLMTNVSCATAKSGKVAFTRKRVKDVNENQEARAVFSAARSEVTWQSMNVQFYSHVWLGPRPSATSDSYVNGTCWNAEQLKTEINRIENRTL
jgi:hypothetical protein